MKLRSILFLPLLGILISGGCGSSAPVQTKYELAEQMGRGPIRVLTTDSTVYTLTTYVFDDSLLTGSGTRERRGAMSDFEGALPFNRILFIEGYHFSTAKTLWVVPMVALASVAAVTMFTDTYFTIEPKESQGSCPTVYSFDGTSFHLEAEAFGTSISKVLEAKSFSVLSSLAEADGRLTVRIANERPETHMINAVQLFAADAGNAAGVVLDVDNRLWPLSQPIAPSAARDASGRNTRALVEKADGQLWKSDLTNTTPGSGFRDAMELEFDIPQDAHEATLVVHAINTDLIAEVYRSVGGLLGDATMQFYQALENDPVLLERIRHWLGDCSLSVEILDGDGWTVVGSMIPEANMVLFSRAIRLRIPDGHRGPLRVRLSTLTDVWRIDAVTIDPAPASPLAMRELPLISVQSSGTADRSSEISRTDDSYAVLLPPEQITCAFDPQPVANMKHPVYVFAAQGYLYEWFPTDGDSPASALAADLEGSQRVEMLKLLIAQKDLFLPPIYAQWRKSLDDLAGKN
ncbi:MAG: hypothetical protein IH600_17995 [Bacteroidetes bacterium]|nr:hypothetical protein [Bacteroidota bacterium]